MKKVFEIKNADLIPNTIDIEKMLDEKGINVIVEDNKVTIDDENLNEIVQKIDYCLAEINSKIVLVEYEKSYVYRKVLLLNNLDCANCARKVEEIAKRRLNNEFLSVDYATTRFIIETKDKELYDNIIEKVQEISNDVDKNIIVSDKELEKNEIDIDEDEPFNLPMFIIGASLFIILVVAHYLVLPNVIDDYNLKNINDAINAVKIPLISVSALSYLMLGGDVLLDAFRNIKRGRIFDEKFLMSIATLVAFGIHSYLEAIAVMAFYKLGELLQDTMVRKSRKGISKLIDIKPNFSRLIVNEKEIEVDPTELSVGDIIVVRPGERIPADGIIIEGEANLDTSSITGESKYYEVAKGKKVVSGSINIDGVLYIEVKKKYADSMVSKILNLVENANTRKAKTEKFVTKFAKYYTPIVCALAVIIAISFKLFTDKSWHDSLYPAMVFLVVSCPCALIISVPLGYFGAIGSASNQGILIKGSNYFDDLNNVGLIAFDKTGTLTKGNFKVTNVVAYSSEYTKDEILKIAANCESVSSHPIAKSIVNEYGIENVSLNDVEAIEINKRGIVVKYKEIEYKIGNQKFMIERNIKGKTSKEGFYIYVSINQNIIGYVELEDEIRPESYTVISELNKKNYNVVMLTGDNEYVASKVASELGIKEYYSELTPVDKVKKLRKLKKKLKNEKILFVGDGVNDAPVLTNSDVGIAMGKYGTDAAIEVSDIVLMNDDLSKLLDVLEISKKTRKIVVQNIWFALSVKAIVLVAAALDNVGIIKMWIGVFADVGVSLLAVINSLRVSKINTFNIFKSLFKNNRR